MNIFTIIGLVIGFIIGFIIGLVIKPKESKKEVKKYKRRGILNKSYSNPDKNEKFDVQFEIGEIESTGKKSKIVVIECIANQVSYNTDDSKKLILKMVNNTWVDSNNIEWISDDIAEKRNEKIDQILN